MYNCSLCCSQNTIINANNSILIKLYSHTYYSCVWFCCYFLTKGGTTVKVHLGHTWPAAALNTVISCFLYNLSVIFLKWDRLMMTYTDDEAAVVPSRSPYYSVVVLNELNEIKHSIINVGPCNTSQFCFSFFFFNFTFAKLWLETFLFFHLSAPECFIYMLNSQFYSWRGARRPP